MRSRKPSRPASAPGSMTMKAWPMRGRLPSSVKKLLASKPNCEPMSAVTSSSTTSANIAPLVLVVAPIGNIEPCMPALGSAVGWPWASSAQPSGMASPFFAATMSLPRATSLRLRSIINGSAFRRGNTAATGLVPKMGCLPPAAGMAAGELAKPRPTMPAAATARRWSTTTPQWWLRLTPAKAMPCVRAVATASATARSQAGKARPSSASIKSAPPLRCKTLAEAVPLTRPLDKCMAYCATRESPCEPRPWVSASTRARAVLAAMAGLAPARVSACVTRAAASSMLIRVMNEGPPVPGRR